MGTGLPQYTSTQCPNSTPWAKALFVGFIDKNPNATTQNKLFHFYKIKVAKQFPKWQAVP
jgi:hypothetical protein